MYIYFFKIPHHLHHLNRVDHPLPCCSSSGEMHRRRQPTCQHTAHLDIFTLALHMFNVFTSENLSKLDKSSSESSSQSFQLLKSTLSQLHCKMIQVFKSKYDNYFITV